MSALDAGPAAPVTSSALRRANYALALLTLVYAINYLDRQLLSVLMEPIKAEFGVSDGELGMLTGFLFALIYTVAGLPVARIADVFGRKVVLAISLAVWSTMTALTGFVGSFAQLRLARVGVALGEAGGTPPSFALISDLFPPERRATALGIFATGVAFGTLLGNVLGGWIGHEHGWRAAFIWLGVPGLLLAVLLAFSVREPERAAAPPAVSLVDVLRALFAQPTFVWMVAGVSFAAFAGYGFGVWKPSFLMRVHGFSLRSAGVAIGFVNLFTGVASSFLGGYLADRLGRRDPRWPLRVAALSALIALPCNVAFLLWPDPWVALLGISVIGIAGGMWPPPTYATSQSLVPAHMRARATAILLFFLNLIGLGLGPWWIGELSDSLAPRYGQLSIRYALVAAMLAYPIGAYCYWRASRAAGAAAHA
ncbi:MAG: spinster family MFS transporter [Myxococcota bacterium]